MNLRAHFSCGLACLLASCASQSFQPTFESPKRPRPQQIARELATVPVRSEAQVVVGVTTEPSRLLAWRLDKLPPAPGAAPLWEHAVDAKSAPLIAGNTVVTQEGNAIVVRDLTTGAVRVRLGEGARLVGADGEGDAVVITLLHDDSEDEVGSVAYVQGSRVRWSAPLNLSVGTPALARGYVIVPWATSRLSVLDTKDGAELARWNFDTAVLGYARVEGDGIYVGQLGLLRLHGELLDANAADASWIAPVARQLPGQPPLMLDGYVPTPEPDNAYHHVRLDFRVAQKGMQEDTFYARFHRLVFGLQASADQVRFVHVLPRDVVGAGVAGTGLLVVDEAGTLRHLSHDGQARVLGELGKTLRVATLRAPSFTPPPPAQGEAAAAPPAPLPVQLHAAAVIDDARLSAGRVYAVQQLAKTPSAEVTAQLVELCVATKVPEAVRRAGCDQLDDRQAGGEAVLAALRTAPGGARTSALAQAAAHMQLKPAGALLAPQVLNLRTDPRDLPVVISALGELGHVPAAPIIDRFLRLHHAEPEGSELIPALQAATTALATLHAKAQRETLAVVAADGLSAEPLRKSAQAALAQLDEPPKPAHAPEAPVAAAAPAPAPDTRPRMLTGEAVDQTLRPVHSALVQCLKEAPDAPKSLRIAMVVGAAGDVESAFMLPGSVQACAEALVLPRRFPSTQIGRQNVTHVVRLPVEKAKAAQPTPGKRGKSEAPRGTETARRAPAKPPG
jgi:hypothetical protein